MRVLLVLSLIGVVWVASDLTSRGDEVPLPVTTTTEVPPVMLRPDGLGPLSLGMSWSTALTLGVEPVPGVACLLGTFGGALVYGVDNRIASVIITTGVVRAEGGLQVGDTMDLAKVDAGLFYGQRDGLVTSVRAGDAAPEC